MRTTDPSTATPLTRLGVQQVADLIGRLRDPIRHTVGAHETISGYLDNIDDDVTERVVLNVDLRSGDAAVLAWGVA